MDKPKGGRGRTAPYDTKQMRVPVGLESQIQELINRYRDWISEAGTRTVAANNPPRLLDKLVDSFTQEPVDKLVNEIENLNKLVDKLTQERNSLDAEVNQLHARNGKLNLEIAELRQQLKLVDKLTVEGSSDNKPVDKLIDLKLHPMGQRELAKRLGVAHSNVAYHTKKSDLIDWSREHDPDQIGWRFDPNSKLFYPATN